MGTRWLPGMLLLVLAIAVLGIAPRAQAFQVRDGKKILIFGARQAVPNLDPARKDRLVHADDPAVGVRRSAGSEGNPPKLVPWLAESYSVSKDGMTYTFKIDKRAKFQNGEPVTAYDVKFSFQRIMDMAQVPDEKLDDMVRRILTAMFSVGLFDRPNTGDPAAVVSTPAHRDARGRDRRGGQRAAEERRGALPLGADVRSIAVVGYDAGPGTQTMEGGSAAVVGGPVVTPLTRHHGAGRPGRHGDACGRGRSVSCRCPSCPPTCSRPSSGSGPGLLGTYYATMDLSGSPVGAFVSPTIDSSSVLVPGSYSARWTGTLTPEHDRHPPASPFATPGSCASTSTASSSRAATRRVWTPAPGRAAADGAGHGDAHRRALPCPIVIEYSIGSSFVGSRPAPRMAAAGPRAAAPRPSRPRARPTSRVVFVNDVTSEGMDRTLARASGRPGPAHRGGGGGEPADDRRAPHRRPGADAVARAGRRGDRGLVPGSGERRRDRRRALRRRRPVGTAADDLPGQREPGTGDAAAQYPGVDGVVHYDEDIFVGYRYYDRFAQEPLFPFGYGLSYTSFDARPPAGDAPARRHVPRVGPRDEHRQPRRARRSSSSTSGFPPRPASRRTSSRDSPRSSLKPGQTQAREDASSTPRASRVEHGGRRMGRAARRVRAARRHVVARSAAAGEPSCSRDSVRRDRRDHIGGRSHRLQRCEQRRPCCARTLRSRNRSPRGPRDRGARVSG